jgi:hypothetical protein
MSTWVHVHAVATSALGFALVFGWSFCEGVVWPFVAELPLVVLLMTVGFSFFVPTLIATSALGSLVGIATSWTIAKKGHHIPMLLTHPRMIAKAREGLARGVASAFREHMFNGIPVKVYAFQSGLMDIPLSKVLGSAWPRVARIFIVGSLGWGLGILASGVSKNYLGWAMLFGGCAYLFILRLVVRSWR